MHFSSFSVPTYLLISYSKSKELENQKASLSPISTGSPLISFIQKIKMADEEAKTQDSQFKNVLIGVTGSVATIKLGKLVQELLASKMKVCNLL